LVLAAVAAVATCMPQGTLGEDAELEPPPVQYKPFKTDLYSQFAEKWVDPMQAERKEVDKELHEVAEAELGKGEAKTKTALSKATQHLKTEEQKLGVKPKPAELGEDSTFGFFGTAFPPINAASVTSMSSAAGSIGGEEELGEGAAVAGTNADAQRIKAQAGLFNLVPLFKKIAEDKKRNEGILFGCITSVKTSGFKEVCRRKKCDKTCTKVKGKGRVCKKKPGSCKCVSVQSAPLTGDAKTIWTNAQKDFCPHNNKLGKQCDAVLCYKFPGPTKNGGTVLKKPYYTIKRKKLMMEDTDTNGKVNMYAIYYDLNISLEKVVFCEKYNPAIKDAAGGVINQKCRATKKCTLVKAEMTKCRNEAVQHLNKKDLDAKGIQKNKYDAKYCPQTDKAKKKFGALMRDMQAIICAKI